MRRDSAGDVNPPVVGNLPNRALPVNSTSNNAIYTTEFVIGDLSEDGTEDVDDISRTSFTTHSSNTGLVSDISVQRTDQGPRSYTLTATTNNNGATGVATIWIDIQDPNGNATTTSFVLQLFAASKAPPSIGNSSATFEQQVLPATSVVHNFTVADADTALADFKVKATSSNTIWSRTILRTTSSSLNRTQAAQAV